MGTGEEVLIIEPEEELLAQVRAAIAGHFGARFYSSAAEAIETANGELWKAMVYDMAKPGTESLKNVRCLKRTFGFDTPLILVADENSLETERAVAGLNVFYYLLRPFPARDLVTLLRAAIDIWDRRFGTWMWLRYGTARADTTRATELTQE
jgi:DNA-binding response OmpR family regulator